jgi:hypothetical protein
MAQKRSFKRVDGWQNDLLHFVDVNQHTPFEYGVFDCALWAADCLRVQTGFDIAERWRGKYTDLTSGMRLVKNDGFKDHVDVFAQQMYEVPGSHAQFGDLVTVEGIDSMTSVGICMGHVIYAPTQTVMGVMLLASAIRTFRVARVEGDEEFYS